MSVKQFILLNVLFTIFVVRAVSAQDFTKDAVITGKVTDASTREPLISANVYLSDTFFGAASGRDGKYTIYNVPPGTYQIIVSYVGYEPFAKKVQIEKGIKYTVDSRLKPRIAKLDEVLVTAEYPKEWKKQLKKFTKEFLGTSKNAKKCTIINPEVLSFEVDDEFDTFRATAEDMLIIENKALGYTVHILLGQFAYYRGFIRYKIYPRFEMMKPVNNKEQRRWQENRMETFAGSLKHFLAALADRSVEESGFEVTFTDALPPEDYYSIAAHADSICYPGKESFERELNFKNILKVIYLPGKEERSVDIFLPRDVFKSIPGAREIEVRYPASWITITQRPVIFDENGYIYDSYRIMQYGAWPQYRIADMLPREYNPADTLIISGSMDKK